MLPRLRIASLLPSVRLALVALVLAACGGEEPAGPGVVRPALTLERAWAVGESESVARIAIPDDFAGWKVDATRASLEDRPTEDGVDRVAVLGSLTMKTIEIPLEPGLGEFNQVRCKLIMRRNSSFAVDLLSEGRVLTRTDWATVIGNADAQVMTLDIPSARTVLFEPDAIVLRFAGGARWAECWDIELRHAPWETWAAEFTAGRGRPEIGRVAREALAIASDNPAHTSLVVPEDGRMQFHYATAPGLGVPGKPAQLEVLVESGGTEALRETFELPKPERKEIRWLSGKLDLAAWSGREVQLSFSLQGYGPLTDYALVTTPTVYTPVASPRTVLFVTSDTHRADHIGSARDAVEVRTPTLDALSARGVAFDDCYSSTNITVPSHVALLTAIPPRDTLVLDNMSGIAEEAQTLADGFRQGGWATLAAVSGPQLQDAWSGLGQGFDAMASPIRGTWNGAETADRLAAMLEAAEDRDLFVWLHLFDAHRPYDTESEYLSLYWPEGRDPADPGDAPIARGLLTGDESVIHNGEFMNAGYKAEVTFLDSVLERVFSIPRIERGWIAVTADHGECLGEYQVWWNHVGLYPENLDVPLILAGPDVPPGRRVVGPVQHLDVGRTLLDLAGLDTIPFPGETLLRHLEREPDPDTPRFGLSSEAISASLRLGDWHCILHLKAFTFRGKEEVNPPHSMELYDLSPGGDPLLDVASEELDRARRMRSMILAWLDEQSATGWVEHDTANEAERLSQVQALGYTGERADGSSLWIEEDCACEFCELYRER